MTLCPYFGSCSGCTIQNLSYAQQLEKKRENIANYFRKIPHLEIQVFSDQEFSYRNRMEFIFYPKGLGLRAKDQPNKIIDITHCPISMPIINELLSEVRTHFPDVDPFNHRGKKGLWRGVVLRTTLVGDSSISFILNDDGSSGEEIDQALAQIKQFSPLSTAKNIIITFVPSSIDDFYSSNYSVIKGKDFLQETLCGKSFLFPIQGFFQNNSRMAEKMLEYAKTSLQHYLTKNAELLDLYSGVGIFGICCAELFKKTTFIESVPESINFAQQNGQKNNIKNMSAHVFQAHQLSRLKFLSNLYVIADPPRSGMEEKTIIQLNTLQPKVIIYISCNPFQLSKDIIKFKKYTLKSLAFFDLFPQTWHAEAIAVLERK